MFEPVSQRFGLRGACRARVLRLIANGHDFAFDGERGSHLPQLSQQPQELQSRLQSFFDDLEFGVPFEARAVVHRRAFLAVVRTVLEDHVVVGRTKHVVLVVFFLIEHVGALVGPVGRFGGLLDSGSLTVVGGRPQLTGVGFEVVEHATDQRPRIFL